MIKFLHLLRLIPIANVLLWLVPLLVVVVMVIHNPERRSVTPAYSNGSEHFWQGADMYAPREGGKSSLGFHYLPQAAILFTPLYVFPKPWGDVVWRCLVWALLGWGFWRLAQTYFPHRTGLAFFIASLVAMPVSLAALRNGQANAFLAAALVQTMLALVRDRRWIAAFWMGIAVAIKPLMIVLAGLSVFVFPSLIVPLIVVFVGIALFPFLCTTPSYLLRQYDLFAQNLYNASAIEKGDRFADIAGLVRFCGGDLPPTLSRLLRAGIGVVTLLAVWLGARLTPSILLKTLWLATLTASYLMLFNPMTEVNSYCIIAPVWGLWTGLFFFSFGQRIYAATVALVALAIVVVPALINPCIKDFDLASDPAVTLIFLALVTVWWFRHISVWGDEKLSYQKTML